MGAGVALESTVGDAVTGVGALVGDVGEDVIWEFDPTLDTIVPDQRVNRRDSKMRVNGVK